MKRNETLLVYAVTGVLLFILAIAVVFGGDPAGATTTDRQVDRPKVAMLPGVRQALMDPDKVKTPGPGAGTPGTPEVDAPVDPATIPIYGPVALRTEVTLPSRRLEDLFGTSERRGEFRVVKAWRGATLRQVVERWCGTPEVMPEVLALNETTGANPQPGDEILLPWIEPETLLTAKQTRDAERKKIDWARGEAYVLKRGDSLWKVASQKVRPSQIPGWLESFKKLNPEITNLDALVEGQKVRLPR